MRAALDGDLSHPCSRTGRTDAGGNLRVAVKDALTGLKLTFVQECSLRKRSVVPAALY